MNCTVDDTQERRSKLLDLVNEFRSQGRMINRYTLQPALEKQGFKVSFSTIYRDMTSLNQKNTWVRDLAQSNYSAYQESISDNLEWIEQESKKKFEEFGNNVWLNIILRVQETRMKHTNGENINIAAALLGKKFNEMKKESSQEELIDVIKLANSRRRR